MTQTTAGGIRFSYVFVVDSRLQRRASARVIIRTLTRRPSRIFWWLVPDLVRLVSGSPECHVAIGFGNLVLDPSGAGDRLIEIHSFIERYPCLSGFFRVPSMVDPDIESMVNPSPKPVVPSVVRWMTKGKTVADQDCVSVVAKALRRSGVCVPGTIVTPAQLRAYLEQKGYEWTSLV
jgi:hypothetical protein